MRTRAVVFGGVLAWLAFSYPSAAPLHLRVMDQTGAPFPDVLVIVKSLEGKGEIFRALTDQAGGVPERKLAAGLYRVIATCPYGICETKISEFLLRDTPVDLELKVGIPSTRDNVVIVGPSNRLRLGVIDTQGRPAGSAQILVRDSNAEFERWYKANGEGEADVEPLGAATTFVVLYQGTLTEETISATSIEKLRAEGKKLVIHLK